MTALELCADLAAAVARSEIMGTERPMVGDWHVHEVRHATSQYAIVLRGSRGEPAELGVAELSLHQRNSIKAVFCAFLYCDGTVHYAAFADALNAELARRNQTRPPPLTTPPSGFAPERWCSGATPGAVPEGEWP